MYLNVYSETESVFDGVAEKKLSRVREFVRKKLRASEPLVYRKVYSKVKSES